MELSINFLVVLILAIAVFGYGLYFSFTFFAKANDLKSKTNGDLEAQMEKVLCENSEKVCLGIDKKEVAKGKYVIFGAKVINVNGQGPLDFKIDVTPLYYIDVAGMRNDNTNFPLEVVYQQQYLNIKDNDYKNIPIAVQASNSALRGATYVYDVKIQYKKSLSDDDGGYVDYDSYGHRIYAKII